MSSCLPENNQLSITQDSEKVPLMLENCLCLFGTAQSAKWWIGNKLTVLLKKAIKELKATAW